MRSGIYLLGIQEAADRAAALTQQLLAFGRKQMMRPTLVDLREVLDDTGRMLKRLIGEHIHLAIAPGAMLSPVLADRGQLGQVIINLAINARDAMPNGGRLTIEAHDAPLTEEYADSHFAVAPGIVRPARGERHRPWNDTGDQGPHLRALFSTKPQGKGTGLGLSTVFGIVKQFGGHIFVFEPGPRDHVQDLSPPRRGCGRGRPLRLPHLPWAGPKPSSSSRMTRPSGK